jgi:methionine-S-sulfoxide reductase
MKPCFLEWQNSASCGKLEGSISLFLGDAIDPLEVSVMDKKKTIFFIRMVMYTLLFVLMIGCSANTDETMGESKGITDIKKSIAAAVPDNLETATFAGGCFWCMEPPFEKLVGVYEVISGYTGGEKANPTYEQVSSGGTGHIEAVQIKYDPAKVNYETLLEVFWRQINPTDAGGQFVDRGYHYTSAIFYHNDIQKLAAEKSKSVSGPPLTISMAASMDNPELHLYVPSGINKLRP